MGSYKENIEKIINSIIPVSKQASDQIYDLYKVEEIAKNNVFVGKNNLVVRDFFLLEGFCKSYVIGRDGQEVTISFFKAGEILSPSPTRVSSGTSIIYIKALTTIKVAACESVKFEELIMKNMEVFKWGSSLLEVEILNKVDKEVGMATLTAKERLLNFRKKYHLLENIIPHSDIASYLGITNTSFSRLRKELKTK
ncbi:Crp/Fnr family transcriptional regulator [Aquimarina rhabdastrellae]